MSGWPIDGFVAKAVIDMEPLVLNDSDYLSATPTSDDTGAEADGEVFEHHMGMRGIAPLSTLCEALWSPLKISSEGRRWEYCFQKRGMIREWNSLTS